MKALLELRKMNSQKR